MKHAVRLVTCGYLIFSSCGHDTVTFKLQEFVNSGIEEKLVIESEMESVETAFVNPNENLR